MASCDKFTKCLLEMFSRVLEKAHKKEKGRNLFLSVKSLYILFVQRKSFCILDKLGKTLERILSLIR